SVGAWGSNLSAVVDNKTKDPSDLKLFNLTILETDPMTRQMVNVEKFLNVSIDDTSPRYVPRVLKQSSQLVRVKKRDNATPTDPDPWEVPTVAPNPGTTTVATADAGSDGGPLTANLFMTTTPKQGIHALDNADLFNILCIP